MLAIIPDDKYIYLQQISPAEELVVSRAFSARDPRHRYMDHGFDGWYKRYNPKYKRLSRAFLADLRQVCEKNGLPLTVDDQRPPPKYLAPDQSVVIPNLLPVITLEDYQIGAIKACLESEIGLISIPTGGGKCLGKGTRVLMHDGSIKLVEDIVIGDLLMGDDSTPRKVLSLSRGVEPLYRVDQKNGDPYVVNESHILSLKCTKAKRKHRLHHSNELAEYGKAYDISLKDYLSTTKHDRHLLKGYKVAVEFKHRKPPFDPYLLGLWLGDGIAKDLQFCLGRDHPELVEYLRQYCNDNGYVLVKYPNEHEQADNWAIRLWAGNESPHERVVRHPLRTAFVSQNLLPKSSSKQKWKFSNKHVPDIFKYNSEKVRLAVLAGFIDTDGGSNGHDTITIVHRRGRLIDDMTYIARSLGFRATATPCHKKCTTTGYVGEYTRLIISGNVNRLPIRCLNKQNKPRICKKNPLAYGISVEPLGNGKYFGFTLDGNGRFLLGDFTVTHNTETFAAICKLMNCPTIIISESIVVIEQIKERLELREIVEEVGVFCSGKTPSGQQIIVGSIQSLAVPSVPKKTKSDTPEKYGRKMKGWTTRRNNAQILRDIVSKCEMLIVDEADRASSSMYSDLFRFWFKGRRRYGFSGTYFDKDKPVQNLMLKERLGSIIYHVPREEVEAKGRIIPVRYIALAIGNPKERYDDRAFDIAEKEFMTDNAYFHNLIKKIAEKEAAQDNGVLILVEKKDLGYALEGLIPGSRFICGDHSPTERNEVIGAFEKREMKVLIGGKILVRGLDLSGGCEVLIIATGGQQESGFDQKIGRSVRLNKNGIAKVYDFFFLKNKYLYGHSRKRLKKIVAMGYDAKVIFPTHTIGAEELIKSRFRFISIKK